MAILRQIAQLGQPVLREQAHQIAEAGDPAIQSLIEDMLVTVAEANGVGIAAPQVYQSLALFIVAVRPTTRYPNAPEQEPVAMLNPELLWSSEEMEMGWEGCLSIPGIRGLVPRHRKIRVRYLTRFGELREEEYEGFLARVFQHEFDHINGIVFLDRADSRNLVTEKECLRMVSGG
jgi:peptide deformylase